MPTSTRVTTLLLSLAALAPAPAQEKISAFGQYAGYSQERFHEWVTTSGYVAMRDGVRLAVDVTRPAVGGQPTDEPLPVVWTHSRYHRNPTSLQALFNPGADTSRPVSMVDTQPSLQVLVRHGYVVAAVGVRGSGASFGRFEGLFSEAETRDAAELCAWFAKQPWCDGNVGMYGGSYLGITQYMAASQRPPALKAIFPDVAAFDMYDLLYPGGAFHEDMIRHWDELTDQLDVELAAPPVDGDDDRELLKSAIAEHVGNWQVLDGYRSAPFRDDAVEGLDWSKHGPAPFLEQINQSGVAMYHSNGWFDVFALDTLLWYANYTGPQKVLMGNWSHAQMTRDRARLTTVEQQRWFDRWLKGIENGVEDEAPIHYALHVDPGELEWRSAWTWPPAGVQGVFHAFSADGGLAPGGAGLSGVDEYAIDPTTTTGSATRWDNAVGAAPQGMNYSGLAARDEGALTWTTAPLERDLTIVGHPLLSLFLTSTAGDADLVVLLEEVDAEGRVHYLTEGVLRASRRKPGQAPYDNLGLPWQRCAHEDVEPLPEDAPAQVRMDLLPIAAVVQAGNRVRVSLTCADADNLGAPSAGEGETLRVFRGGAHPSGITLPLLSDVWVVRGTVTDRAGHPVQGAVVRAHCGMGTLFETGRAVSDAEGRYVLEFGPGGRSSDGVPVQAATISARKPGWFETDLGRQGDLYMAAEAPEPTSGWGAPERTLLPNQPRVVDFVLDRGALVEGWLVDAGGAPIVSREVVLAGDELPPSSNVLDVVRTDATGRFVFESVPTNFRWWLSLRSTRPEQREKAGPFAFDQDRRWSLRLVFEPDEGTEPGDGQRGQLWAFEWPHVPVRIDRWRWRAPQGWVEHFAGDRFSLVTPPDWVRVPVRGIDSYVGKLVGPGVELSFDHGVYSSRLTEFSDRPGYEREELSVGGHAAVLVRAEGFVGLHFPELGTGPMGAIKTTLGARCEGAQARATAEQVLRSVRFPTGR